MDADMAAIEADWPEIGNYGGIDYPIITSHLGKSRRSNGDGGWEVDSDGTARIRVSVLGVVIPEAQQRILINGTSYRIKNVSLSYDKVTYLLTLENV